MMVKEIEKSGIPVVHITALTAVALTVGSNRILQAVGGVAYNTCDPMQPEAVQAEQRYTLMCKAVSALCTDIHEQTIFQ